VGIERLGREYRTAHLRTVDQRRLKATAGNDDQAAICLRLSGDNAAASAQNGSSYSGFDLLPSMA
jgi:hypothetical protein